MKAWMDQVLSPGQTFEISAAGPKPLHNITSVVLLVASGGVYKEDDERDALTRQVRAAFGFIGISDIRIAWADGQNPLFFNDSEVRRETAFEAAEELAEELAEESAEG
jgi:FMN-dependent NADH-azoreductase